MMRASECRSLVMMPLWLPVKRNGVAAQFADGDGEQRHGDALAGGKQHVQLAPGGVGDSCLARGEQLVRRVAHRRDDHAHRRGRPRGSA